MDNGKKNAIVTWVNAMAEDLGVSAHSAVSCLSDLKDCSLILQLAEKVISDGNACELASLQSAATDTATADGPSVHLLWTRVANIIAAIYRASICFQPDVAGLTDGNELDVAKVCLLLLGCRSVSESGNMFIRVAITLDVVCQYEIKDMMMGLHELDYRITDADLTSLLTTARVVDEMKCEPQAMSTPVGADTPASSPSHCYRTTPIGMLSRITVRSPPSDARSSPLQELVCSPSFDRKLQEKHLLRQMDLLRTQKNEAEAVVRSNEEELHQKNEELEVLRRQLSQCESKLARLERNQKDEMDIDTDNKLDELQSLRDRLTTTLSELTEARQQCQFLERENTDLYSDNAKLRASTIKAGELDVCRHQLSSAEARVGELEEELARCDAELARYTGDLATTQCVIGQLTEHNRHLQDELKRLQERSFGLDSGECMGDVVEKILGDQINVLTSQRDDVSAQLNSLTARKEADDMRHTAEMEMSRSQLQQLEDKLQMSRKEVARVNELMTELQVRCGRHKDEVLRSTATIETLQQELRMSKAREDDLEEQLEQTKSELEELERELEELQRLLTETTSSKEKLEEVSTAAIETLETELTTCKAQEHVLEGELQKSKSELSTSKAQEHVLEEELENTKLKVQELERLVTEMTSNKEKEKESTAAIETLETELTTCKAQGHVLEAELQKSKFELSTAKAQEHVLEEELENTKSKMQELDRKVTEKMSSKENYEERITAAVEKFETEMTTLKAQEHVLKEELQKSKSKLSTSKAQEHVRRRQKLKNIKLKVQDVDRMVTDMMSSKEKFEEGITADIETIETELTKLKAQEHVIEEELENTKSKLEEFTAAIETLETELTTCKAQEHVLEEELQKSKSELSTSKAQEHN